MSELSSANWILEKLKAFAHASGNDLTEREIFLLKQPVAYFNETNRSDFQKVNEKTVKLIRATIMDEKLDGAECVEARRGLFIPPQWRQNYLDVYESNLPWFLSHCLQNAMLHDPTLGETKNWESPRITSGFRDSILKQGYKIAGNPSRRSSATEFATLSASIRVFLLTLTQLIRSYNLLTTSAGRGPLAKEESLLLSSRVDLLNILASFSEHDDDVTAAWFLLALDEEIHDTDQELRELLKSKTGYGISQVVSKQILISDGLVLPDYYLKPSAIFVELIARFDLLCKKLQLEPIATKWYAVNALMLAIEVKNCSVFTTSPGQSSKRILEYASLLSNLIDAINQFDVETDSLVEFFEDLTLVSGVEGNPADFQRIVEFVPKFFDHEYTDEWFRHFLAECDGLVAAVTEDSGPDDDASEVGHAFASRDPDSIGARLIELQGLYREGLISEDEFEKKRSKIIDEL